MLRLNIIRQSGPEGISSMCMSLYDFIEANDTCGSSPAHLNLKNDSF